MNAFLNETNSLWFDTRFLPFYITCDSVHLLINFAVVHYFGTVPHLCCSVEGCKIEDDIRLNRAYDPSHDLCIFDLPFGMCLLVHGFVRSRIHSVNMTPKLFAFDKDLKLECSGGVVLSIKMNKEDIIFFSRHDAKKKRSQEEKKTKNSRNQEQHYVNSTSHEQ